MTDGAVLPLPPVVEEHWCGLSIFSALFFMAASSFISKSELAKANSKHEAYVQDFRKQVIFCSFSNIVD